MATPWLENYVAEFAELGPVNCLSLSLIGEEYRARQRWGDRPGHQTFVERFSGRHAEILELLSQIDRELRAESDEIPQQTRPHAIRDFTGRTIVPFDPRAPLV